MIANKKIMLLHAWKANIFAELSLAEIMNRNNKKTKTWVFHAVKELTKNNLLISKRKANIDLYSLNIKNPLAMQTLQFLEIQQLYLFEHLPILQELTSSTPPENYCLLIFGSYADHKQKKDSDLDLCFLVPDKTTEKKIKPYLQEVKHNHTTTIDAQFILFDEFIQMLLNKEENLGKQIFKKHLLFFKPELYYHLLIEAHNHGFNL